MGLGHGEWLPPEIFNFTQRQVAFDISGQVDENFNSKKLELRYGPVISGVGVVRDTIIDVRNTSIPIHTSGLFGGLRRYVVKYNPATGKYEHLRTYRTCALNNGINTYPPPENILDVSLLNERFNQVSGLKRPDLPDILTEAPPSGLMDNLNKIFNFPILNQELFIDCRSKQFDIVDVGSSVYAVINSGIYKTQVFRYGLLKNNQAYCFQWRYAKSVGPMRQPPEFGRCCTVNGCFDNYYDLYCYNGYAGDYPNFTANESCPCPTGSCDYIYTDPQGAESPQCVMNTKSECDQLGGVWNIEGSC